MERGGRREEGGERREEGGGRREEEGERREERGGRREEGEGGNLFPRFTSSSSWEKEPGYEAITSE